MPRAVALGGARMLGWVPRHCSSQEANSAEPVTVTTRFLTDDGTDSGAINKFKLLCTLNGRIAVLDPSDAVVVFVVLSRTCSCIDL